jgi:hypothetical protein
MIIIVLLFFVFRIQGGVIELSGFPSYIPNVLCGFQDYCTRNNADPGRKTLVRRGELLPNRKSEQGIKIVVGAKPGRLYKDRGVSGTQNNS